MSSQTLSPSRLTAKAAGLKPMGSRKAEEECRCAMCGTKILAGEMIDDFAPGDGFTDHPALNYPLSPVICGDCKAVWRKEFMQKYSKSIISEEGVFPSAKMENQAHWLLNPPNPPFIFILSDQQQQHLIWRAPVNLSRDVYQIRFGGTVMTVRRDMLLKAFSAAKRLVETFNAGKSKAEQFKGKHPFVRLDWNLEDLNHGMLRQDFARLEDEQSKQDIALLRRLTNGELWALCVLLAGKDPVKPEPVCTPTSGL
jgi:CRISPR type IV-associated protein Csf1